MIKLGEFIANFIIGCKPFILPAFLAYCIWYNLPDAKKPSLPSKSNAPSEPVDKQTHEQNMSSGLSENDLVDK